MVTEHYDHIIIGAGSAGCVLTDRLSIDPSVRGLLLEAGGADVGSAGPVPAVYSAARAFQHGLRRHWTESAERAGLPAPRISTVGRRSGSGASSSRRGWDVAVST